MNNIEILEKLKDEQYTKETVNTLYEFYDEEFKPYVLSTEERDALENLIQENKKLSWKYENAKDMYIIKDNSINENYIPKSKVREKIKEFNVPIIDVLDKLPIMPRTIERGCGAKDGIIYVLQELLEEGE